MKIDNFVKRKYNADPVKLWKRQIDGEDDEDEDEDEDEATTTTDYDYLLSMSTGIFNARFAERQESEMLLNTDVKLAELAVLREKTAENLWAEDLDSLMKKLDEVEKKEIKQMGAETRENKPSPGGKLVEFSISAEMLKKFEKADATSRKKKGVKKCKEPGKSKPKKKPVATKSKKEEKPMNKSDSDDDIKSLVASCTATLRKTPRRRAALKKINFLPTSDSDETS